MGDQTADASASTQDGANQTGGSTADAGEAFKPITTQDELNKVLGERLDRERSKFADYKDLKAKASKYDELEAANKSEIEKANDKAAAAEALAQKATADALRLRVALKHNVSDEDADLFLTGTDEATLTKQAERLTQRAADTKKSNNVVPREGASSTAAATDERAFVRELFGG